MPDSRADRLGHLGGLRGFGTVGVSRQSINELLRVRRAVSPEMTLRLARLFGDSPESHNSGFLQMDAFGNCS